VRGAFALSLHGYRAQLANRGALASCDSPSPHDRFQDCLGEVLGIIIDFNAALWRRIAALELEVAECRQALTRTPRRNWQYKVYTTALIEAERRLSVAEGMPRDEL
jgi:hypothetical protein